MAKQKALPSLFERVAAYFANVIIFYFALRWASGDRLPTGGLESVWFLSALALWAFKLLSAPYFAAPQDAFANAIAAALLLETADLTVATNLEWPLDTLRWCAIFYCFLIATLSLISLTIYRPNKASFANRLCFGAIDMLGKSEILYTPGALISIIGAYHQYPITVVWLIVLWTTFVIAPPLETALWVVRLIREYLVDGKDVDSVGTIERIDDPNIVRVRLERGAAWKPKTLHIAALSNGEQHFVLAGC